MARFRKKPIEVDAVQVTKEFLSSKPVSEEYSTVDGATFTMTYSEAGVAIETLEGTMVADIGNWILTGVKGEKYPCRDDIFRETYDPVPPDAVSVAVWKFDSFPTMEEYFQRIDLLRKEAFKKSGLENMDGHMFLANDDANEKTITMKIVPKGKSL